MFIFLALGPIECKFYEGRTFFPPVLHTHSMRSSGSTGCMYQWTILGPPTPTLPHHSKDLTQPVESNPRYYCVHSSHPLHQFWWFLPKQHPIVRDLNSREPLCLATIPPCGLLTFILPTTGVIRIYVQAGKKKAKEENGGK